jgi:hypothetical protein
MQRSARQILGDKFEIWLELLLQELDHKPIYRNVEFHKERYIYRQADLIWAKRKYFEICIWIQKRKK